MRISGFLRVIRLRIIRLCVYIAALADTSHCVILRLLRRFRLRMTVLRIPRLARVFACGDIGRTRL